MDQFLKSYFLTLKGLKKQKLPGDGGHRDYTRILYRKKSFILMSCGAKDTSLKQFIKIQKKLAPVAPVPQIFCANTKQGYLLLEDLGDVTLEDFFIKNHEKKSLNFYQQAICYLIAMQQNIKAVKSDPFFDKKFFLQENKMTLYHLQTFILNCVKNKSDLPANTLLKDKTYLPSKTLLKDFKKDMKSLLNTYKIKDYVYCHRDYHSRNLMLKNKKLVVIDFQDAGLGPLAYDLTSLLYDSYVPLSLKFKKQLIAFYFDNLPIGLKQKLKSKLFVEKQIKQQFLQRGLKACGRFAAFKNESHKSTHLKYIYPTLRFLKKIARELAYKGIYNYIDCISPAFKPL